MFSIDFLSHNFTGKSKNIMFIFNGIVTCHCGVTLHPAWPFAHAHYRNQIEFRAIIAPKKTDSPKNVPLMLERNAFGQNKLI